MNAYAQLPRTIGKDGLKYDLMSNFGANGYVLAYVHDADFSKPLLASYKGEKNEAAEELLVLLKDF